MKRLVNSALVAAVLASLILSGAASLAAGTSRGKSAAGAKGPGHAAASKARKPVVSQPVVRHGKSPVHARLVSDRKGKDGRSIDSGYSRGHHPKESRNKGHHPKDKSRDKGRHPKRPTHPRHPKHPKHPKHRIPDDRLADSDWHRPHHPRHPRPHHPHHPHHPRHPWPHDPTCPWDWDCDGDSWCRFPIRCPVWGGCDYDDVCIERGVEFPVSVEVPVPVERATLDLELVGIRMVEDADLERGEGAIYRVWIRNNSSVDVNQSFDATLSATMTGQMDSEAIQATTRVGGVRAGDMRAVDVRLPVEASLMGSESEDEAVPFKFLTVVADSRLELMEANKANNRGVFKRVQIPALAE